VIDFGTMTTQLISTYWWLLPLFVLATLFKTAWFKSKKGTLPRTKGDASLLCFCERIEPLLY